MAKLPPLQLQLGNVVLVEFEIKRYTPKDHSASGSSSQVVSPPAMPQKGYRGRREQEPPRQWTNWEIGFQLNAVSLVYEAAEHYVPPEPRSEDVEF